MMIKTLPKCLITLKSLSRRFETASPHLHLEYISFCHFFEYRVPFSPTQMAFSILFITISSLQVPVPNMPQSLTTFDLLVQQDLRFPLACLGVYRHHSRRGLAGERYRLHLVDLNSPTTPTIPLALEPVSTLSHALSPPAATPTEPKKFTKTHSDAADLAPAPALDAITTSSVGKIPGDFGRDNNSVFLGLYSLIFHDHLF